MGFEVGPLVGTSFSISAPGEVFERVFGVKPRPGSKGMLASGSYELPQDGLPLAVRNAVHAVTFTPPPDFGPRSFA
jgi:hypothetical protein